jgi:hypothetical protein
VGLSTYYGAERSGELEGPIQEQFASLDEELGKIRRGEIVKSLRDGG